ncbi:MAG: hypothetical protein GX610_22565 [Rhodococcus sp.]|nr:hypothetical protein [Rhodococcus sp. (in: high G+C Gram-positive bacteria)]
MLHRLLLVAALTPAQAALLLTDVIDQLELAQRERRYPLGLAGDAVTVSETGQLGIDRTESAASWTDVHDAAKSVLHSITANCSDYEFAERLDPPISEASDLAALAQLIRREAETASDPAGEPKIRRQIASLVSATTTERPSADCRVSADQAHGQDPATEQSLAPKGRYLPVRNVWHRKKRRPSRRTLLLLLSVIPLLVGAVWFGPGVWSDLRQGWEAVLDPVDSYAVNQIRPVSPPPPLPPEGDRNPGAEQVAAAPMPVDTGAPPKAGPITEVTATLADGTCAPGGPCAIRVDVHLDPVADVGDVAWELRVYDRCSGKVDTTGPVTMSPEPGRQQVYGISRAALPPGSALALAAVTSAPDVAASEPVFVPDQNATC